MSSNSYTAVPTDDCHPLKKTPAPPIRSQCVSSKIRETREFLSSTAAADNNNFMPILDTITLIFELYSDDQYQNQLIFDRQTTYQSLLELLKNLKLLAECAATKQSQKLHQVLRSFSPQFQTQFDASTAVRNNLILHLKGEIKARIGFIIGILCAATFFITLLAPHVIATIAGKIVISILGAVIFSILLAGTGQLHEEVKVVQSKQSKGEIAAVFFDQATTATKKLVDFKSSELTS